MMDAVFALAAGTDITTAAPEAVAGGMTSTFLAAAGLMITALVLAAKCLGSARKRLA